MTAGLRALIVLGLVAWLDPGRFALQAQPSILPADPEAAFSLQRPSAADASSSVVRVTDQPFTTAIRVVTRIQPADLWNIQLNLRTALAVEAEDVLLATFYHRIIEPAGLGGFTTFVFEQASTPWSKSANQTLSVGSSVWQKTELAFESLADYAAGAAQINFQLGFAPQTIEIGGINVVNFAKTKTLAEVRAMIDSSLTYSGREPDAPWREAAAQRIDAVRKANLTITVRTPSGLPVPDADVQVRMTRHAFKFGTAVSAARLLESSAAADRYRSILTNDFNRVVLENNLKWPTWEWQRQRGLDAVEWLIDHELEVRGHNILWPSWRYLPDDVEGLAGDPEALRDRINRHITDIVSTLRGKLVDWDVINEPYSEHDLMDILGQAEMVAWFDRTWRADPGATLYLNDYAILAAATGTHSPHQNHYFETIQYLLDEGAPLGGIGMQGHFQSFLTPPETLYAVLERFAVFDLPIQITEFDVEVSDPQLQADYLRDFMTLVFSHPQTTGILMWGFWEGQHWRPEAALYRNDWTLRPHGDTWYDLVDQQWWTHTSGRSDATGQHTVRAFKGDYQVTATGNGLRVTQTITLENDRELLVVLGTPTVGFFPEQARMNATAFELHGWKPVDRTAVIEVSTDLSHWTAVHTNSAETSSFEYADSTGPVGLRRFYRASVPDTR